ncbi:MAG: glycosyltransferase family 39 protein [Candidatus Beckwithbacteria bacterium]|nr:glycosyltransferase family 39 protein [Candidatus Beckwithbacteria bacterium]
MALGILIVVFLISRLVNLTLLPIFADEAIYIRWTQLINQGHLFVPLSDGKTPLFMWLLAPLLWVIKDPLLAGRLLSVASGLATLLGVYFLAKKLFSLKIAVISSLLVIISPFLLFYDRISLTDSLLTALTLWSFYVTYQLFNRPSLKLGAILGLLAGMVLLTKPSGLLFLLLNVALVLLFPFKKIKSFIKPGILAILISLGLYNCLRLSGSFPLISSRSADYLRSRQEILQHLFQYFLPTAQVFFSWLVSYFSWPALVLIIISLLLAIKNKTKITVILFVWSLLPVLVQISIGKIIYPRYLLPIVPFLLIICSWGITKFNKFVWLLGILFLFYWLRFDWLLLTNPIKAPLDPWERGQYLEEWSSGYGLKEIRNYLNNLPKDQSVVVATEGSFGTLPNGLEIYFNHSSNVQILGVGFPSKTVSPGMEQALAAGKKVYLVVNFHRYNLSDIQRLKLISEYPRPGGEKLMFYEVH